MSLRSPLGYSLPEETARVARAAFPKGNPYLRLADVLGPIFPNPDFADLYSAVGQPAEDPAHLALVTLFQFAEGLTDRQAADAVRSRIDWKYALCLPLDDDGFDASVLAEFRARFLSNGAERRLFERLLEGLKDQGVVKGGGRQRTDSTQVLAAIRSLSRLGCVGETVRHALNAVATVAPGWLRGWAPPEWDDRYGQRRQEARLPTGPAARQVLAEHIGADGRQLLAALDDPSAPGGLGQIEPVRILRRGWLEQYHAGEPIRWRTGDDLPPAAVMIASPYDEEARASHKRETVWTGYKVHLTETCDADAPHLITHVETTVATTQDVERTAAIPAALAEQHLLPREHLVDMGYRDSGLLLDSPRDYGVDLVGPLPGDTSWQARAGAGFDLTRFTVDWAAEQAICPRGKTSWRWLPAQDDHDNAVIHIKFRQEDGAACPARSRCTRSKTTGRQITVRPQAAHAAIQAARQAQTTTAFQERYALRAGVEGTISQSVRRCAARRSRYIGLAKTALSHTFMAAALNLVRLATWLAGSPPATTRPSAFAALAPMAT
jgi:transposase